MDTKQAILSRRSVRKFLDKEVSKEDITTLLEAGCNAPSACNKKPLRFFVITDKKCFRSFERAVASRKCQLRSP